jgi:hypothetical protein
MKSDLVSALIRRCGHAPRYTYSSSTSARNKAQLCRRTQASIAALGLWFAVLLPSSVMADCPASTYKPFRYDEDYRYLADPACRTDLWDPLKYIPLGTDPNTYLSFGGELRERAQYYSAPDFGLRGGANSYLLHRLLLSTDLHVTEYFRAFVQLGNHMEVGKHEPLSPTDVDRLDLQQGFFDLRPPLVGDFNPTLRAGRQEMAYGSQRLVSVREPPNIRRSFDGFRLFDTIGDLRVDAFATRPVQLKQGVFDDQSNYKQAFWGVYSTVSVTRQLGVDLYYLGFNNELARFGTMSGDEHRQTFGTRIFGSAVGWDWNFEGVAQFGSFSGQDIRAWTVASDSGYTLTALPWLPRLGLKANIASGDHHPGGQTLGTFNPLFPKLGYFTEASLVSPSNFFDFQPSVTFIPADKVGVSIGWDFLWRETTSDAVYTEPFTPIPGTAGHGGRTIGNQVSLDVGWQVDRHIQVKASYVHFFVGNALQTVGGHDVDFAMASAAYKF